MYTKGDFCMKYNKDLAQILTRNITLTDYIGSLRLLMDKLVYSGKFTTEDISKLYTECNMENIHDELLKNAYNVLCEWYVPTPKKYTSDIQIKQFENVTTSEDPSYKTAAKMTSEFETIFMKDLNEFNESEWKIYVNYFGGESHGGSRHYKSFINNKLNGTGIFKNKINFGDTLFSNLICQRKIYSTYVKDPKEMLKILELGMEQVEERRILPTALTVLSLVYSLSASAGEVLEIADSDVDRNNHTVHFKDSEFDIPKEFYSYVELSLMENAASRNLDEYYKALIKPTSKYQAKSFSGNAVTEKAVNVLINNLYKTVELSPMNEVYGKTMTAVINIQKSSIFYRMYKAGIKTKSEAVIYIMDPRNKVSENIRYKRNTAADDYVNWLRYYYN